MVSLGQVRRDSKHRVLLCTGNIDLTAWSIDIIRFTESRYQISRCMFADIPIVAIWHEQE